MFVVTSARKKAGRKEEKRKEEPAAWWCTPLILSPRRTGRQVSEFKASMIYILSSRAARAM